MKRGAEQPPFARGGGGISSGIIADDSYEQIQLRLTGLVVKRGNRLTVYNPIYAAVFDRAWVERTLADLRPDFYGSAFRAWQEAEAGQNQGFLLRGQALEDAEVWARGKRISDVDEQFLRASREVERKEILKANQILQDAEQKAKQRLKRSVKIGFLMIFLSVGIVGIIGTGGFFYVSDKTNVVQRLENQKLKLEEQKFTLLQSLEDTEVERAKIKLEVLESDAKAKLVEAKEKFNDSEVSEKKKFKTRILNVLCEMKIRGTKQEIE